MQSGIPSSSSSFTRQAEQDAHITHRLSHRVRVLLVIVSLVLLAIALYAFADFYRHYLKQPVGVIDFSTYYSAAYALRMNPQANIYDQALLTRVAAQIPGTLRPPCRPIIISAISAGIAIRNSARKYSATNSPPPFAPVR